MSSLFSSIPSWKFKVGQHVFDHSVHLRTLYTQCYIIWRPSWLRQWKISLQCKRPRFDPWVMKIPWRREWQPTPIFLPGESHGQRSLVGYIVVVIPLGMESQHIYIEGHWLLTFSVLRNLLKPHKGMIEHNICRLHKVSESSQGALLWAYHWAFSWKTWNCLILLISDFSV